MSDSSVSSTVFAFVLVLCILLAYSGGVYTCWFYMKKKRALVKNDKEEKEQQRMHLAAEQLDSLRKFNEQYAAEADTWRVEAKRRLVESEVYRRKLESAGIPIPERPLSVALSNPSIHGIDGNRVSLIGTMELPREEEVVHGTQVQV